MRCSPPRTSHHNPVISRPHIQLLSDTRRVHSLETICLLMCYKIKYKENFFLLRGNHEASPINRIYGFYDECKSHTFGCPDHSGRATA